LDSGDVAERFDRRDRIRRRLCARNLGDCHVSQAGTRVETNKPMAIVTRGPYRSTRNPIYLAMFLGQTGLAIGLDSLWILAIRHPSARDTTERP
jgi:hypothetical protein